MYMWIVDMLVVVCVFCVCKIYFIFSKWILLHQFNSKNIVWMDVGFIKSRGDC